MESPTSSFATARGQDRTRELRSNGAQKRTARADTPRSRGTVGSSRSRPRHRTWCRRHERRPDVFVHDRRTDRTTRTSVNGRGRQGNDDSSASVDLGDRALRRLSARRATNLVPTDANGFDDLFVHDRATGTTSSSPSGRTASRRTRATAHQPGAISADGRFITFHSAASNLVKGDANAVARRLRPRPSCRDDHARERELGRGRGERVEPRRRASRPTAASSPSRRTPPNLFGSDANGDQTSSSTPTRTRAGSA